MKDSHDPADWPAEEFGDEPPSLASFLGSLAGLSADESVTGEPAPCPQCEFEMKTFRHSHCFGCPFCYVHFQNEIRPILARFHRHATHLGKVPQQLGASASRDGELTRLRVALSMAIRQEEYETAARLRDSIRELTAADEAGAPAEETED